MLRDQRENNQIFCSSGHNVAASKHRSQHVFDRNQRGQFFECNISSVATKSWVGIAGKVLFAFFCGYENQWKKEKFIQKKLWKSRVQMSKVCFSQRKFLIYDQSEQSVSQRLVHDPVDGTILFAWLSVVIGSHATNHSIIQILFRQIYF